MFSGLRELTQLVWLNLSGNSIKVTVNGPIGCAILAFYEKENMMQIPFYVFS